MKMKKIAKGFGLCMVGFIGGVGVTSYGVAKYVLTHDQMRTALVEEILTTLGIQTSTQQNTRRRSYREYCEASTDANSVIFKSREDAEKALESMTDLVNKYGYVTVADLSDLAGTSYFYSANKYGWDDLSGSYVKKRDDGYIIVIPSLVKEINK